MVLDEILFLIVTIVKRYDILLINIILFIVSTAIGNYQGCHMHYPALLLLPRTYHRKQLYVFLLCGIK